jgi:hypothetical protein
MCPDEMHVAKWPTEPGSYRVVQIYVDQEPRLLFAPQSEFHRNMLRSLGEELGRTVPEADFPVPGTGISTERRPALKSDWYDVAGMGICFVIPSVRHALFGGESMEYRVGISREHLDSMKPLVPNWDLELSVPRPKSQ